MELQEAKNVLVTGGAGFIGAHLCERLIKDGCQVICVDNFSTSHVRNIDPLLPNPRFQFLRLDVNDPIELEKYTELSAMKIPVRGIQEIYHLACPTAIKKFDDFRIATLRANAVGNERVLELARKYRSRVLLASSSVVYGPRPADGHRLKEEELGAFNHLSPRACYDEGKRFSETMFETYRQVYGLDAKIARIFRTYGPKMPLFDGHLIPDFVLNALENKELIIYGSEDFRTSLIYVTDIVDGLLRLMQSPPGFGPVNLGSDIDLKIRDVAQMVITMTDSRSVIRHEGELPFLSQLPLPDLTKAKELGWFPLVRLEDGLRKAIEYAKANRLLLTSV